LNRQCEMTNTIEIEKELESIMPKFLTKRRNDILILSQAIETKDFKTIRDRAHIIAGSGGGYGLDQMSIIGAQMEEASTNENIDKIKKHFVEYSNYLKHLKITYV